MQLQEFTFDVEHCKGTENAAADCFTRINCLADVDLPLISDEEVLNAQKFDTETQQMKTAVQRGLSKKPESVSLSLWKMRSVVRVSGVALTHTNGKLFVPFSLRRKVLVVAHGCHHGVQGTSDRK